MQEVTVPKNSEFEQLVPHMQGISLVTIMKAILEGTQHAYAQNKFHTLLLDYQK